MSTPFIITGFIVSTIGFSIFIYGKKQRRLPQLMVGMFLMAAPMFLRDPAWLGVGACLSVIGLRVAVVKQW